jgi:uncharacterized protein YndB with AHSA1/START domain
VPTITVEKSVIIDRPAHEVWRFISEEHNVTKWHGDVHSHAKEENTTHQVRKFGGHRMEMRHEVQHDHESRTRDFRGQVDTNFGMQEYEGQHIVTPAGDNACTVTSKMVANLAYLPAEAEQAMERMAAHTIEGNLMTLKHLLEASPELHEHLQQAHPEWHSSS